MDSDSVSKSIGIDPKLSDDIHVLAHKLTQFGVCEIKDSDSDLFSKSIGLASKLFDDTLGPELTQCGVCVGEA